MATKTGTRRLPLRNARKRKLLDGDDRLMNHDFKRRKTGHQYNMRHMEGFCNFCTNPYKLIGCTNCFRSWHYHCFEKYVLNAITKNDDDINENIENDGKIPLKPTTVNKIATNHKCIIKQELNDENKERSLSVPNVQCPSMENWQDFEVEIIKLLESEKEKQIQKEKTKNPDPIFLKPLPSIITVQNMKIWFDEQRDVVEERSYLHHNERKKQIIAVIDACPDCINDTHSCFICKKQGNLLRCSERGCNKYYHRECLKSDPLYSKQTQFRLNGNIKCPRHHCWRCHEFGIKAHQGERRKFCWYCPRSYHRNCVPSTAELLSVQRTDTPQQLVKYPQFRFDLITCCWNDDEKKEEDRLNPPHPSPQNLEFGRNDEMAGIFLWNLNVNTSFQHGIAEFYSLNDDPFSIPLSMKTDYEKRVKSKIQRDRVRSENNPYPKGFKRIKASRYSVEYRNYLRNIKKKKNQHLDAIDHCSCTAGCKLFECENFSMDIECDETICGTFLRNNSFDLCENRQFETTPHDENVKIVKTPKCGFGAFAKKDLKSHQLIIEYVGEVITKQESNHRLAELNKIGAPNFYFFQVDSKTVIDATHYGNQARFLNHSCNPNCHTIRFMYKGEERLGIFAKCDIKKDEQLTYDYQYEVPNCDDVTTLAKCHCGEPNCRQYLGFNKKKAKEWMEQEAKKKEEESSKKKKSKKKKNSKKKKSKSSKKKSKSSKKKKKKSAKKKSKTKKKIKSKMNGFINYDDIEQDKNEKKDEDDDVVMDVSNKENENPNKLQNTQ